MSKAGTVSAADLTQRCRWTTPVLVVAVVACVALRVAAIDGIRTIHHDDAIAFLAATGHMGEYSRMIDDEAFPFGTWAKASDWKRYIEPEDAFCFGRISDDLASKDIHPPLYFWLLHVWSLLFGVHLWTGPSLNLLIALGTVAALFGFARFVLADSVAAAFVTLLWAVSPTVFPSTVEVRQYELLALCTVLFVWQVGRCGGSKGPVRRAELVKLAVVSAVGMLTHYHFPLVVIPGGAYLIYRLIRTRRRTLVACMASMAVGFVAFWMLHPGFAESIGRSGQRAGPFGSRRFEDRVDKVMARYASFFVDVDAYGDDVRRVLPGVVLAVAFAAFVWRLVSRWRDRRSAAYSPRDLPFTGWHVAFFFMWLAGSNVLLYLTFLSPTHAMGAKYPAMVWPFCAFLPVCFALSFRRHARAIMVVLAFSMMVTGTYGVMYFRLLHRDESSIWEIVTPTNRVLVDNVRRGVLPVFASHFPDDCLCYAADTTYLRDHETEWFPDLRAGDLWVTSGRTTNSRRATVARIIEKRFSGHRADRVSRTAAMWVLREK